MPLNPERVKSWGMLAEAQSAIGRLKRSVSIGLRPTSVDEALPDNWPTFYRTLFCVGVGDFIALSGLIVVLSKGHASYVVRCLDEKGAVSAASFFVGYPNIRVVSSVDAVLTSADHRLDEPGFEFRGIEPADVDLFEAVYSSFGVPYAERWNSCPIPEAAKLVPQVPVPDCRYMFVHDDSTRGMFIDPRYLLASGLSVYRPAYETGRSILAFRDVIENAEQIHVIDSSFFHLCEQFNPRGALYFHRYPKRYRAIHGEYRTRHNWRAFL